MSARFIDNFEVILLDQGQTFMFGNDRFGPGEDYYATYTHIGGKRFSPDKVTCIIEQLYSRMSEIYSTQKEALPSISEVLLELFYDINFDEKELLIFDDLIALHEIGVISEDHRQVIHSLSATHKLGIISDIWARSTRFKNNLRDAGILDCFEVTIWSSDHRMVKPSSQLFETTLNHFNIDASQIVYVGDNLRRDIEGSKAHGLAAIWVNSSNQELSEANSIAGSAIQPDLIVQDIQELLTK